MVSSTSFEEIKSESFRKLLEGLYLPPVKALSASNVVDFQEPLDFATAELKKAIVQHNPLNLLARLAYESSFCAVDMRSEDEARLMQFHIELLQMFVVANKEEWWQAAPKVLSTKDVVEHLNNVSVALALRQMQEAKIREAEGGGDNRGQVDGKAEIKSPEQLEKALAELFASSEKAIEGECGFSPVRLAKMLNSVVATLEARVRKAEVDELLLVMSAKYFADIKLSRVKSADVQFQLAELRKTAQKEKWLIDRLKLQFREWWLFRLAEQFLFSIDELKEAYGGDIEGSVLEEILKEWSLKMGALEREDVEISSLANMIFEKPFLKIGDGKYCLYVPGVLREIGVALIENAVKLHRASI